MEQNVKTMVLQAERALEFLGDHAMEYEEMYDYEENDVGEYKYIEGEDLEHMKEPIQKLIDYVKEMQNV